MVITLWIKRDYVSVPSLHYRRLFARSTSSNSCAPSCSGMATKFAFICFCTIQLALKFGLKISLNLFSNLCCKISFCKNNKSFLFKYLLLNCKQLQIFNQTLLSIMGSNISFTVIFLIFVSSSFKLVYFFYFFLQNSILIQLKKSTDCYLIQQLPYAVWLIYQKKVFLVW